MLNSFIQGFAICALLAVVMIETRRRLKAVSEGMRQALTGLLLGLAGAASIAAPFELVDGLIFDFRNVAVLFAGLFVGAPAALVATVVCIAARVAAGGSGVFVGVLGLVVIAACAIVAARLMRGRPPASLALTAAYAATSAVLALSVLLYLPDEVRRFISPEALTFAVLASTLGTLCLAYFERGEIERDALVAELAAREREAHDASEARTRFFAIMSHEIRTPANALLGFLDLGLGDETPDRRLLAKARGSGDALLRIIDDVLGYISSNDDAIRIEEGRTDLAGLVERVTLRHRPEAARRGLGLETEIAADLPATIRTDALRIEQMLDNALSNALKFSSEGTIRLRVQLSAIQPAATDATLLLQVEDEGRGMDDAEAAAAFEPFSRFARGAAPGSGLGLYFSRRLARRMGGSITLDSARGRGTVVTIRLPVGLPAARPASEPCAETSAAAGSGADAGSAGAAAGLLPWEPPPLRDGGQRVLMVEDNRLNAELLTMLFEADGVAIDVAPSGEAALARLAEMPPDAYDLVVMDVQMPGMDGFETTRRLRALPAPLSGLPVVGLSAFAERQYEAAAIEAGMDIYLTKPVDLQAMKAVSRRLMTAAPPRADRGAAEAVLDTLGPEGLERLATGTAEGLNGLIETLRRQRDDAAGGAADDGEVEDAAAKPDLRARILAGLHDAAGQVGQLGLERLAAEMRSVRLSLEGVDRIGTSEAERLRHRLMLWRASVLGVAVRDEGAMPPRDAPRRRGFEGDQFFA